MARNAKTTTKSKPVTKPVTKTVAKKTTTNRVVSSTVVSDTALARPLVSRFAVITPQSLVAEAVGTFGLVLAAITAPADQSLLVGLTLAVLLVAMMRVSGGHFNPAVTFGLWAINKVEAIKLPFFWIAQFIGALAAFIVVSAYNGNGSNLDMSSFAAWDWRIFWVELIGTTIFLFGMVASLKNISGVAARAAGIGLSFAVGLVIAGGLLTANATREQTAVQGGQAKSVSQTFAAQGPALNPATALAQTERDVESINKSLTNSGGSAGTQKTPSHFTLSVILGSLVGAALGTNLYVLLAGLSWRSKVL